MRKIDSDYFRNLVFGIEDSLVSTVGVVFGVASASYDKHAILLMGLIVIAVESLSMGAGSFLSETSAEEVSDEKSDKHNPLISGIIMFFSYFAAGFIPLFPYMITDTNNAKYISIAATFIALFFLGYLPVKKLKAGLRMMLVAGGAVLIGFSVAATFKL